MTHEENAVDSTLIELSERYHVAKLALFNIRLLNRIRICLNQGELLDLIDDEARRNNMGVTPSPLNQSTYIQFSYICLVWLWEAVKAHGMEEAVLEKVPDITEKFGLNYSTFKLTGPRCVNDWNARIRILRNGLSHCRVCTDDESFTFSDQDNRREAEQTNLTLSWEDLAKLSECIIHAVTPIIWPKPDDTQNDRLMV